MRHKFRYPPRNSAQYFVHRGSRSTTVSAGVVVLSDIGVPVTSKSLQKYKTPELYNFSLNVSAIAGGKVGGDGDAAGSVREGIEEALEPVCNSITDVGREPTGDKLVLGVISAESEFRRTDDALGLLDLLDFVLVLRLLSLLPSKTLLRPLLLLLPSKPLLFPTSGFKEFR